MLRLKLRPGDRALIGDNVEVVCSTRAGERKAFLEIEAPRHIPVKRLPLKSAKESQPDD